MVGESRIGRAGMTMPKRFSRLPFGKAPEQGDVVISHELVDAANRSAKGYSKHNDSKGAK